MVGVAGFEPATLVPNQTRYQAALHSEPQMCRVIPRPESETDHGSSHLQSIAVPSHARSR